jgi:hypothetical protein
VAGMGDCATISRWMRAMSGILTIFASNGNGESAVATGGLPKARYRKTTSGSSRSPAIKLLTAKEIGLIGGAAIIEEGSEGPRV